MAERVSKSVPYSVMWGQLEDHMGEGDWEHVSLVLGTLEKTSGGRSTDLSQFWHRPAVRTRLLGIQDCHCGVELAERMPS